MMSRLSQNTFILLLSNGGSAVLSFALSVLIGRVLGEEGLGVYTTALAWVFPLSLMAEFGLGTLITRDVAQDPKRAGDYLYQTTIIRLIFSSVIIGMLWFIAPLLSPTPDVVTGIRIASPLILILPLYGSITAIFRAEQEMKPILWLNIGMLVSQVILTGLVFATGGDILNALIVNTLTSAGQLIAAYFVYRRWFAVPRTGTISISSLLKRATPFAISAVLVAVQLRVGIILLEQLTTTEIVGEYAAAYRFVEAGRMLPNALFGALFPALVAIATVPKQMNQLFTRISLGLAGYGLFFALVFTLMASTIVNITYGDRFDEAVMILQVIGWTLLPGGLRSARTLYWYARGHEHFVNWVALAALLTQIGSALILIDLYGAVGLAYSLILTEIIGLGMIWKPLRAYIPTQKLQNQPT